MDIRAKISSALDATKQSATNLGRNVARFPGKAVSSGVQHALKGGTESKSALVRLPSNFVSNGFNEVQSQSGRTINVIDAAVYTAAAATSAAAIPVLSYLIAHGMVMYWGAAKYAIGLFGNKDIGNSGRLMLTTSLATATEGFIPFVGDYASAATYGVAAAVSVRNTVAAPSSSQDK